MNGWRWGWAASLILLVAALLAVPHGPARSGYDSSEMLGWRPDDAAERALRQRPPGSHLNVFLPSLPYIYTSHAINAGFIRPANNDRGWQYDVATDILQLNDTTYDVTLRDGVRFQDGSPFNADAVLLNMQYFKKAPFLFTNIDKDFDYAEKIDDRHVRFHLKEKYGQFFNDLIWLHFYTKQYLEKFGWNGKATCPNLAEPGPYGLGPFILKAGYVEGDRHSAQVELVANPYYWDKRYPMVEGVTIFTEMTTTDALQAALYDEKMDIAPVSFDAKEQTILSPYAKAVISPSLNTRAIHFNMRDGNPRLLDLEVRKALNIAIKQSDITDWVDYGEGRETAVGTAPDFPGVRSTAASLKPYSTVTNPDTPQEQAYLRSVLSGLTLKVILQERFMPLFRAIDYRLAQVGVHLQFDVVESEKDVFAQLLTTNARKNDKNWDILIWGDDDWYYNHPWSSFLVFRTSNYWSTISQDDKLDGMIAELFRSTIGTAEFDRISGQIMKHVYDNAYMLFAPNANQIFAVNKEVAFTPYRMASMPLWEIAVTPEHWSVRRGIYPQELRKPVQLVRYNFGEHPEAQARVLSQDEQR